MLVPIASLVSVRYWNVEFDYVLLSIRIFEVEFKLGFSSFRERMMGGVHTGSPVFIGGICYRHTVRICSAYFCMEAGHHITSVTVMVLQGNEELDLGLVALADVSRIRLELDLIPSHFLMNSVDVERLSYRIKYFQI